ncbi:MAG: hypothetical protein ACKVVT_19025 [Dehalococcoidia bacterium]
MRRADVFVAFAGVLGVALWAIATGGRAGAPGNYHASSERFVEPGATVPAGYYEAERAAVTLGPALDGVAGFAGIRIVHASPAFVEVSVAGDGAAVEAAIDRQGVDRSVVRVVAVTYTREELLALVRRISGDYSGLKALDVWMVAVGPDVASNRVVVEVAEKTGREEQVLRERYGPMVAMRSAGQFPAPTPTPGPGPQLETYPAGWYQVFACAGVGLLGGPVAISPDGVVSLGEPAASQRLRWPSTYRLTREGDAWVILSPDHPRPIREGGACGQDMQPGKLRNP